jgi:tetratricopeptide (TPR) repeat protein
VESSIIPIPNVIFEHRLYLPIFGIILIVIIIFYTKLKRILIILIITTAILSYLTHNRNIIWQSENKLWEESYLLSPNKARPNNNYAAITIMDNKILESYLLFKTSLKINPNYSGPLENIYRLFTDIGDINNFSNMDSTNVPIKHLLQYYLNRNMNNEIKTMLREIDIRSINTRNIFYLINVANQLNDVDIYNKLISLSDSLNLLNTDDKIQLKLMNVLKDSSNFTLDDHQLTKIKDPKIKVIYNYNKSRQYALEKKYETAINYIMDALELDNRPEFYHLRAAIFFNVGNYLYAAMDYTSAFKLSGDPEFVKYRAMCYERMGHEESAKNEWRYYKILMEKEGEKGEIPESTFGEGESSPGL